MQGTRDHNEISEHDEYKYKQTIQSEIGDIIFFAVDNRPINFWPGFANNPL